MNASQRHVEEETDEGWLVLMAHTAVDPGTMVVHLLYASLEGGREEREGREK